MPTHSAKFFFCHFHSHCTFLFYFPTFFCCLSPLSSPKRRVGSDPQSLNVQWDGERPSATGNKDPKHLAVWRESSSEWQKNERIYLGLVAFLLCHLCYKTLSRLETASLRRLLQLGAKILIFSFDEWVLFFFFLLWGRISKVSEQCRSLSPIECHLE